MTESEKLDMAIATLKEIVRVGGTEDPSEDDPGSGNSGDYHDWGFSCGLFTQAKTARASLTQLEAA